MLLDSFSLSSSRKNMSFQREESKYDNLYGLENGEQTVQGINEVYRHLEVTPIKKSRQETRKSLMGASKMEKGNLKLEKIFSERINRTNRESKREIKG